MHGKTIPMEYIYFKHHIYTSLNDVELVVEYPNSKMAYFKINEEGLILEKQFGLETNPCRLKEEDYYYLDHCTLKQLQEIEPLRKKFEFSFVVNNLQFLRDYFSLETTKYQDFDMPHANILSETQECLKQMMVINEDPQIVSHYNSFNNFCDEFFFDFSGSYTEDVKIQLKQSFNDYISFLEEWNF